VRCGGDPCVRLTRRRSGRALAGRKARQRPRAPSPSHGYADARHAASLALPARRMLVAVAPQALGEMASRSNRDGRPISPQHAIPLNPTSASPTAYRGGRQLARRALSLLPVPPGTVAPIPHLLGLHHRYPPPGGSTRPEISASCGPLATPPGQNRTTPHTTPSEDCLPIPPNASIRRPG
jgi:hypothetical protein